VVKSRLVRFLYLLFYKCVFIRVISYPIVVRKLFLS
jgi:hypothetical protein